MSRDEQHPVRIVTCTNCGRTRKEGKVQPFLAAVLSVILLVPLLGDVCDECAHKYNLLGAILMPVVIAAAVIGVVLWLR